MRVKKNPIDYDVRLFLNGLQVATDTVAHYDGIRQSPEKPMIAAEPDNGAPTGSYFEGYIYAVTVNNYVMDVDNILLNKTMRDGGRYFGIPSYYDYLDSTEGIDWRIKGMFDDYLNLSTNLVDRFYLPLMNDRYVPQGLATDGEDTIYMSMYWKHEDGSTGDYPSVVTESTKNGKLKRVFQLHHSGGSDFVGHVGGIAYWDDYIYLPYSSTTIMRYDLSSLSSPEFNSETFANPQHDDNPIYYNATYNLNMSPNTGVSFMSAAADYDGTLILWVGQFDSSVLKYIFGYQIYSNGSVSSSPLYTFKLPVAKVQGIYCHQANRDTLRFYFSTSYGDNPSYIYDVTYNKSSQNYTSIYTRFQGPAGLEGMAMIGADLWCAGESGAKYYQKRTSSPWQDFFPFVFSCRFYRKGDINIDGNVDGKDLALLCDQWLGTPGQPSADIAETWGDGVVDFFDFAQLAYDWQKDIMQ